MTTIDQVEAAALADRANNGSARVGDLFVCKDGPAPFEYYRVEGVGAYHPITRDEAASMLAVEPIARAFAAIIREACADQDLDTRHKDERRLIDVINRKNASPEYAACCATHDYYDSNMGMGLAFGQVMGREPDAASEADADLINRAWTMAKQAGFGDGATLFNCCTDHTAPEWSAFTNLEIGGCMTETDEKTGETYTNGGIDRHEAEFFTIYGRMPENGCEAITDCDTLEKAMAVAALLSGLSGLPHAVDC